MSGTEEKVIEPIQKLIKKMSEDAAIAEQLRRAGEQEVFRKKLQQFAHLKRLFSHHPETILAETRETIAHLSGVISQALAQRGIRSDWFRDITQGSSAEEVVSSPIVYLRKAIEIAEQLSPERDKLDSIMAKDPVMVEFAKAIKLAELAKAGKISDPTARERIINTAAEAEKNRKAHIARKYELELLAVWGPELKLLRLRREVLELESAIICKLHGAVIDSIAELVKIAESPDAAEILEQAKTLRMQASFEKDGYDAEPTNLEQVQKIRTATEKSAVTLTERIEKNEETIKQLIDLENELLQLLPTLNARAEWKPVHRPVQKSGYSAGPGPAKIKHRGRMVTRKLE